jgi:hypothetical protein
MSRNKKFVRFLPLIFGGLIVCGVAAALVLFISSMLQQAPNPKKQVQQISLIKPPPPPPPEIEKPPEPEVEEVKMEEPETPEEMPDTPSDEPPPGDLLGLDAEGLAGSDGFGLIGKKGGRSLLGSGDGSEFKWYTNRLSSHIEDLLYELSVEEKYKYLRNARYSVKVKVWIGKDLQLKGELINSTGDRERDKAIRRVLAQMGQFTEPVPAGMEQPVRILIRSRL